MTSINPLITSLVLPGFNVSGREFCISAHPMMVNKKLPKFIHWSRMDEAKKKDDSRA